MAVSIKEEGLLLLDQSSDYMSNSNNLDLANTLDLPDNFDHVVNQLDELEGEEDEEGEGEGEESHVN